MGAGSSRGPTAASSAAAASVGEGSQHSRGSASGKGLLSGLIERLPERLVLGSARLACWETDRTSPQLAIGRRVTSSEPRARDEVASVNGDSPSMLCGSNDETHSAEMSLSGGLGSRRGTCGKQDTAQLIIDLAVLSHHAQAERGTSTSFVSGFNRGLRSELKKARKSVDSAVAKLKKASWGCPRERARRFREGRRGGGADVAEALCTTPATCTFNVIGQTCLAYAGYKYPPCCYN